MTYIYYEDYKGEWRWRLKADNGKIIAISGEGYTNQGDCLAAIELVKGSGDAPVRREPPKSSSFGPTSGGSQDPPIIVEGGGHGSGDGW